MDGYEQKQVAHILERTMHTFQKQRCLQLHVKGFSHLINEMCIRYNCTIEYTSAEVLYYCLHHMVRETKKNSTKYFVIEFSKASTL